MAPYCNRNIKLFICGREKNKGDYEGKFWIIYLKTAEIESNDMVTKKNKSKTTILGNTNFV